MVINVIAGSLTFNLASLWQFLRPNDLTVESQMKFFDSDTLMWMLFAAFFIGMGILVIV